MDEKEYLNYIKARKIQDDIIKSDMPVIEKYTNYPIYRNIVNNLINIKTNFKREYIELNQLADRIIQEKKILYG